MARSARILAVTAGLVAGGAAFGALAGALALAISVAPAGLRDALDVFAVGGAIGAAIGAVAAPLAGWLLLRRVPLGRAVVWTTLGAVAGGVAGWTARSGYVRFETALLGAVLGFVVAALAARRFAARPTPDVEAREEHAG